MFPAEWFRRQQTSHQLWDTPGFSTGNSSISIRCLGANEAIWEECWFFAVSDSLTFYPSLQNSFPAGGVAGDCSGVHLIAAATRPQPASHNVLPSVVATRPAHTQAPQPSVMVQSLNVHGLLPAQFPPGTETLHDLCLGLPGSSVPHLLQLLGELLLVSLHRIPVTRISSRSQHSGHLENNNLPVCWGLLFCF